jgi:hypothetical protein
MFINYAQLPEIMWSSVLDFFQVSYGAEDLVMMKETLNFDAKNPSIRFDPEAAHRGRPPSDSIRFAADKWVGELYGELSAAASITTIK